MVSADSTICPFDQKRTTLIVAPKDKTPGSAARCKGLDWKSDHGRRTIDGLPLRGEGTAIQSGGILTNTG
jgi:hypothetical protein